MRPIVTSIWVVRGKWGTLYLGVYPSAWLWGRAEGVFASWYGAGPLFLLWKTEHGPR